MRSVAQRPSNKEAALEARVRELERQMQQIPSRWAQPILPFQVVKVIGGQLIEDNDVIQYLSTDPAITKVYDPDVDTDYPVGLGRGYTFNSKGQQDIRVLIRHNWDGRQAPLEGGWVYVVSGKVTLQVPSGPDHGKTFTAYTVTFPV